MTPGRPPDRLPPRVRRQGPALLCAAGLLAACSFPAPPRPPPEPPRPVVVAVANDPVTLDPHLQDEEVTSSILGNVYEALTAFDGEMGLGPALALRWENPDDLAWRFHLRPGVVFHDGRPLTAADVVASLERARSHPRSRVASYLQAVASVQALDAETVEVRTLRPYPILLNKLAFVFVLPADAPGEVERPVGTGPYRFLEYERGRELALGPALRHWRAVPGAGLRFLPLPQPAQRVAALREGRADAVATLPFGEVPKPAPGDRFRFSWRGGLSVTLLGMRVDRPPFSDPRLRRAVHLALDREALSQDLFEGHARPLGQLVGESVFGWVSDLAPPSPDPAAARALLAEAGHPGGLDVALEFQPGARAYCARIAGQLAAAGFRVALDERSWNSLYPRLLAGEAGFFFLGHSCQSGDASDIFDALLHSPDARSGFGDANFAGYRSAEMDRLVEAAGSTLLVDQRRTLLDRAMRLAMTDLPYVPLWARPLAYGTRDDVAWRARLDGRVLGTDIRRLGAPR